MWDWPWTHFPIVTIHYQRKSLILQQVPGLHFDILGKTGDFLTCDISRSSLLPIIFLASLVLEREYPCGPCSQYQWQRHLAESEAYLSSVVGLERGIKFSLGSV